MTVNSFLLPMDLQFFAEPEAEPVPPEQEPATPAVEEVPEQADPVPTVEPTPEPEPEATDSELVALKQQLAELQAAKEQLETQLAEKGSEVSATTSKVADYENALTKIVDQRLTAIPENIAALMPDGLSVADKLAWVEKAEKAIPVKEPEPEQPPAPVIETIGQPTPVTQEVEVDLKDLTASQKLSNYFQEFFGK